MYKSKTSTYTREIEYPTLNVESFRSKLEEKIGKEFLFLASELENPLITDSNPYSCIINAIKKEEGSKMIIPAIFLDVYNKENSKTVTIKYDLSSVKEDNHQKYSNYVDKLVEMVESSALKSR